MRMFGRRSSALDANLERGYRYALALTDDVPSAEALLQDAWYVALESGNPRHLGFLIRVIRRRFYRATDGRPNLVVLEPPRSDEGRTALAIDELTDAADATIARALGTLRPEEREVVYLATVEGMDAEEIGAIQGRPARAVASLFARARERLLTTIQHFKTQSLR